MIDIELEQKIIQYINNQYRTRWISLNQEWKEYLLQRWDNCQNIKESFLRIKYNIYEVPKCPICGNICKFRGNNWIYDNTCGNKKCQIKLREIKSKQTKLERYGNENYNNISKCKQTKLERYGNENYCNREQAVKHTDYKKRSEKIKQTCLERYGVTNGGCSKQSLEKIKQTCLTKYGVESTWKIPGVKEKSEQTKLERYGNKNYTNIEKNKQTCLERYGVDNVFKNIDIQNKYRQTCFKKYGVDHNWKIKNIHDHCWDDYTIEKRKNTSLLHFGVEHPHQSQIIQNKIFNSKKKNHTFNTSIPENKTYELLKEKYPDVLYQYKDKNRYPFVCDFYIPSLDLFIECNYHWTHGFKPFEGTKEDNIIIENWKSKNTQYYNNAINCWTIRDVKKRKVAKQNNLNYLEIWNIDELKKWINK